MLRKEVRKLLSFMLMVAMMVTLLPAGGKMNARAAEEQITRAFTLYVYRENAGKLYFNPWNNSDLQLSDDNEMSDTFGFDHKQAILQAVEGKADWYKVNLVYTDATKNGGFSIYENNKDNEIIKLDNQWNSTDEYKKLFTGKAAYIYKEGTVSDDLSVIGEDSSDNGNTNPIEESKTFTLYVNYSGNGTLYLNPWDNSDMKISDDNDLVDPFKWGHNLAKLKPVEGKDGWYSVKLFYSDSQANGGFTIYDTQESSKLIELDNQWNYTVEYKKLFTGKTEYFLSNKSITDDSSILNGEPEEDKSDEVLDADLSDAIRGMDVSSYISLQDSFDALNAEEGTEKYGFKDNDGNIIKNQAFFNFLASTGMNYVRLRVWNNPYDANGNGYGGGNNDLAKAIEMGKYATNAGMKVLIDFHNSDFWADPAKQSVPKAWEGKSEDELATAVADYTTESLNKLLDAGVNVTMVQVGNETHGWMCGIGFDKNDPNKGLNKLLDAGCDAVHEVAAKYNREILAVVHFANPTGSNEESYAWNIVITTPA